MQFELDRGTYIDHKHKQHIHACKCVGVTVFVITYLRRVPRALSPVKVALPQ